jgi:hypothetical protein
MSVPYDHDQALAAQLARLVEPARAAFNHYFQQSRMGVRPEKPETDLRELIEEVRRALETHPTFNSWGSRFFGEKQLQLSPFAQAPNLLQYAADVGPTEAVDWLHRIYSCTSCDIRFVSEIYGLKTDQRIDFSNGTSLLPLHQLPPSANSAAIISQSTFRPGITPIEVLTGDTPIAATFMIQDVAGQENYERASTDDSIQNGRQIFDETITALTLIGDAAPVAGITWIEFGTPDLIRAEFGRMWMPARFEGLKSTGASTNIDQGAIDIIEQYLKIDSKVRTKLQLALERLNLARRRTTPGNKAIDGAICLEVLLGDDTKTEINYKISLRAALLLESGLSERLSIKKTLKDFYNLRSKTVHGQPAKQNEFQKNITCAKAGLDICTRILLQIVQQQELPSMEELELQATIDPGRPK